MFGIDDIYWVLINSAFSFVILFIISKILGKKQIAQLEFIDYVVGISLGSIAAEWATETSDKPFYYYLIAMAIFFALAFLCDYLGRKGTFLKKVLKGKPQTLIYNGQIDYKALCRCKIDVNDLLSMLREKNYFDINDVAFAVFETSGELSVLPKAMQRPLTLSDLNKNSAETASLTNVLIADGKISDSGLNEINKTVDWLYGQLKMPLGSSLKNIILATYNNSTGEVIVYRK